MPQALAASLEPRKSPVQARSAASVTAILDATVQVLLQVGKERLTTTRVALRAGVSVGTLYQYFPNKSALLRAALARHLDDITAATERVCEQTKGHTLEQMATALVTAYLKHKMKDGKTSVALYSVSSDVDGAKIAREKGLRSNRAIVAMLKTARETLATQPQVVASVLQATMAGVSRSLLESAAPEKQFDAVHQELTLLACAYLKASSTKPEFDEARV